jgi:magnesium-transporting ATPase (P-type)
VYFFIWVILGVSPELLAALGCMWVYALYLEEDKESEMEERRMSSYVYGWYWIFQWVRDVVRRWFFFPWLVILSGGEMKWVKWVLSSFLLILASSFVKWLSRGEKLPFRYLISFPFLIGISFFQVL